MKSLPRQPDRAPARMEGVPLRAVALCLLTLLSAGCHKKPPPSNQAPARTEGAEPEFYLAPGSAKAVATPAAAMPPLPKPAGALPRGASCVTPRCHATYLTAPQVHGPVAARACDACHQNDAGGHKYPLKRGPIQTCTFCHVVAGTQSVQHAALAQGCTSCHRPHESNVKYLLKADTPAALCAKCHHVPLKKHAHGFFIQGECTVCHYAHQSDNKFLLRGGAGAGNCLMCHEDIGRLLASSSHVHEPANGKCTACHSPHATDYEYRLKSPRDTLCLSCHDKVKKHLEQAAVTHSAVQDRKGCVNCHSPHASSWPRLLLGRQDKVCLNCHDEPLRSADGRTTPDMRPVLVEAKYRHGPLRTGYCSPCHDPHGAALPRLLRLPFPQTFYARFDVNNYALFFSCHQRQLVLAEKTRNITGFRNGEENLHYVHVARGDKGRTCKACHNVHGSNLPKHMADEVPFEGSKWAMPILYEKTQDGGRCAPGCHEPMAYSRDHPIQRPTTKGAK